MRGFCRIGGLSAHVRRQCERLLRQYVHWLTRTPMTSCCEYARRRRRQCAAMINIRTRLKPDTIIKPMIALTMIGFDDDDDDDVSDADRCCCCCCCCGLT